MQKITTCIVLTSNKTANITMINTLKILQLQPFSTNIPNKYQQLVTGKTL